jgi:hypothetical protein
MSRIFWREKKKKYILQGPVMGIHRRGREPSSHRGELLDVPSDPLGPSLKSGKDGSTILTENDIMDSLDVRELVSSFLASLDVREIPLRRPDN